MMLANSTISYNYSHFQFLTLNKFKKEIEKAMRIKEEYFELKRKGGL